MPLIVVDTIRGHEESRLTAVLDGIHDAVVEAFSVPATDLYQVLTQHEPFELRALDTGLGYTRSRDLTIVRVISKASLRCRQAAPLRVDRPQLVQPGGHRRRRRDRLCRGQRRRGLVLRTRSRPVPHRRTAQRQRGGGSVRGGVFRGWVVRNTDGVNIANFEELDAGILGDLDTTVRVLYSCINYKDALALHGRPGVVRRTPLVPGIDFVGEVIETHHPAWKRGDIVVSNGAGLGEELHGGLAGIVRARGDDLVVVPEAFTPAQAAAIGTAGFTAGLSVLALERHGLRPGNGPVLVTGAGGGVGSIAIALLSQSGYEVAAATGRTESLSDRLTQLGATSVVDR